MSETPPARAHGRWLVALLALVLVAGLTLLSYAARRWQWFGEPAPAAASASGPAPSAVAPLPAAAPPATLTPPAAAVDLATLATREAVLSGQVAALEARTASVTSDAAVAAAQAGRAEGLLVAAAARRQIDRGQPLGYLEEQLRQRFGARQPRAVAIVIAAARQPVTLEQLAAGLEGQESALMMAPQDDLLEMLRRELATLVVLRRTGTASPLPVDRLARARRLLAGGQVAAARAEIAALPGAPVATGWLDAARRWAVAHDALDLIETAALTVPPPAAAQAGAAVTTTVLP